MREFKRAVRTGVGYIIPASALAGDNVVERSEQMRWYESKTLPGFFEEVEVQESINLERFPVQYVIRRQTEGLHDYRGYGVKIISGIYRKGDKVIILPSGTQSISKRIAVGDKGVEEAFAQLSVVLELEDAVDASLGDMIVKQESQPNISEELEVLLCWMDTKPLLPCNKYMLQLNSTTVKAMVQRIDYRINVDTL